MTKTEGTSQTYGQLITLAISEDISLASNIENAVAPQDIQVTLLQSTEVTSADQDRKKIIEAAFSDNTTKIASVKKAKDVDFDELNDNFFLNTLVNAELTELTTATVVGSRVKTVKEIKDCLNESKKVDLLICLKSRDSESLEFNNLKIPDFQGNFVYNFYLREGDYQEDDVASRENSEDLLAKNKPHMVPQYVELSWKSLRRAEKLKNQKRRHNVDSLESLPRNYDGKDIKIVDIDNLEKAFNSTGNSTRFTNGMDAVIITRDSTKITALPVKPTTDTVSQGK